MSSGDESRPSSPSLLQNIHRAKRIKFSVEPVKVTCVCEGVKTEMISKQTQVTTEDIATANMYQLSIWDKDELKCDVSHLPNVGFEEEPKDPRNKAFARLVAHELDSVPAEKRSVTYTNIINIIRKVRHQKDLDDISLPSYQDSD